VSLTYRLLHPADHDRSGTYINFVDSSNILMFNFDNNNNVFFNLIMLSFGLTNLFYGPISCVVDDDRDISYVCRPIVTALCYKLGVGRSEADDLLRAGWDETEVPTMDLRFERCRTNAGRSARLHTIYTSRQCEGSTLYIGLLGKLQGYVSTIDRSYVWFTLVLNY